MTTPSPGALFAQAYAEDGDRAEVHFDFTITDAFQPGKERPRLTVRNLFPKRTVDAETVRSWCESRPEDGEAERVTESDLRREAAFRFGMAKFPVEPIRGWVQLPPELADDPEGLARFIDYRLLVRLATAENQALSIGPNGVVSHPDVARVPYTGSYVEGLLAACDQIEQTGATAHAMIINPYDYYTHLIGSGSLLGDFALNEVKICRTRMIERGCALVGDFSVAAELLDGRRSAIKVAEPPEGTFAQPGTAVCAEVREGLAINLPTHFFYAVPA